METTKKVIEIIEQLSGNEDINIDLNLQNDLMLDSLMMVTLLVEIEEVFNIQLDEADMNPYELETVESVVSMVEKYRGESDG